MFGFGKDKNLGKDKNQLVGAKDKLLRAKMLKTGMTLDEIKSKREGKQADNPATAIVMIYIISCAVAFFLTQGPWKNGVRVKSGNDDLDSLLFSLGDPSFVGDSTIDAGIQILARGLLLFLAAGFLPLMSLLWIRGLDRTDMDPFRTMWGVTVGLGLFYFAIADLVIPLIESML